MVEYYQQGITNRHPRVHSARILCVVTAETFSSPFPHSEVSFKEILQK